MFQYLYARISKIFSGRAFAFKLIKTSILLPLGNPGAFTPMMWLVWVGLTPVRGLWVHLKEVVSDHWQVNSGADLHWCEPRVHAEENISQLLEIVHETQKWCSKASSRE